MIKATIELSNGNLIKIFNDLLNVVKVHPEALVVAEDGETKLVKGGLGGLDGKE